MGKEDLIKKTYNLVIITLIVSIASLLFGVLNYSNISANFKSSTDTSDSTSSTDTSSTYDTSSFKSVTLAEAIELFDNSGTQVLFLGSSECSACHIFAPTLKTVQTSMGFTAYYLDIDTVDTTSSNFTKFTNLLTKEITESVNGTEKTGKISEFYGLTPLTIVIKDGKAVDAAVGSYGESDLTTFLKQYM